MRFLSFLLVFIALFLQQSLFAVEGSNSALGSGSGTASGVSAASPSFSSSSLFAPASLSTSGSDETRFSDSGKPQVADRMEVTPSDVQSKKGSFESYVEHSTGAKLTVFGRNLFGNVPSTYAPLSGVQVNTDYVIGPGDALQVRGWGMVDIDINTTVNRSGEIYLPRVGSVNVAGVKYRDLQGHLKKAVSRIFTNFELTASIAQTRSVQIYVLGHAQRPGTYTLSAMSSLLNALFASGGPSATGTMRNIQLKRGTSPPVSIDLYDMLLYGDKSMDRSLQDGDVIYIPEVGPLVALFGNVKKPAIFELKNKTVLSEVINWAGGFESEVDLKSVIIEKNINNRYQTIAELAAKNGSITKELSTLVLSPTDIIRVFAPGSIPFQVKVVRPFALVSGEVQQPGVFQIEKDETLRAFISRAGGVSEKASIYGTVLTRERVRVEQQKQIEIAADRLEQDLESNYKQRFAAESDPEKSAALQKQIEFQRGVIAKLRTFKADGRIILNLKNYESTVEDLPDFPLEDGDKIVVPEKSTTVTVLGSVFQQNTFIYKKGYGVQDYIQKAGGVNQTGDKSRVYRICADGSVQSKKNGDWNGSIQPGDAIVVPEKVISNSPSIMAILKDWTTILYQFGLGAAGIQTLKN